MWENGNIEPVLAPEEAACNLISDAIQWLNCTVRNVGTRFKKAVH